MHLHFCNAHFFLGFRVLDYDTLVLDMVVYDIKCDVVVFCLNSLTT